MRVEKRVLPIYTVRSVWICGRILVERWRGSLSNTRLLDSSPLGGSKCARPRIRFKSKWNCSWQREFISLGIHDMTFFFVCTLLSTNFIIFFLGIYKTQLYEVMFLSRINQKILNLKFCWCPQIKKHLKISLGITVENSPNSFTMTFLEF